MINSSDKFYDVRNELLVASSENESCSRDEQKFIWGLREMLARKMSSNIWGNKYIFQSQDKNIEAKFKKFEKMNNLTNMFGYVERQLSLNGRSIITINKTKTGDVMLNVPNPFYFQGLGKVFVQPQLAIIYQRYQIDNRSYIVKTIYDCFKVVNEVYSLSGDDNKLIRVFDKEAEILDSLQIERNWVHNLGFVPVVELTNLPFYQYEFNNYEFISCADWFPAQIWEPLIYDTFTNFRKELWYCHSRILLEEASQEVINQMKSISNGRIKTDDLIIETSAAGGANFKAVPGNGDFTKYTSAIDNLLDFYFKFAGASRFSEGGGAQKTVAETSSIRSSIIENITNKILLRELQIKDLLKKVLCALGAIDDYWDDRDYFDFSINGNINKDESTFIDNIIKQIDNGLISVEEAIQEIRNVSRQEAKEKFKEIKNFNEQNGIVNAIGLNDMESESGFNRNTGEHQQADKRGLE